MDEVTALIKKTELFTDDMIRREVDWFYGPLGIHDYYFTSHKPDVISAHIQRYCTPCT